jgi:hypothetical protein
MRRSAVIPLLNVLKGERGYLGPPQAAAEEYCEHRPVAQALLRGNVWRVEQRLGLPQRQPVADTNSLRRDPLDARDPAR